MSNKDKVDIKSLSKELEALIDITAESCGPTLIKELQSRIDKTVDMFNKDVNKMLLSSFKIYHDRKDRFKQKLKIEKQDDLDDDFEIEEVDSPRFIKSYEKKSRNKL